MRGSVGDERRVRCRCLLRLAALPALGVMGLAQAQDGVVLQPLEVKARHIEEPVQEVPFGLSAFSRERLEEGGVEETEDLYRSVPNFNYTDSGLPEANLLNIRGIGSSSTFLSPSVTYYVDGVPVPQRAFDQRFVDVEQIEVLRGPQGTLFGQNSQAGAVNISTAEPTDEAEYRFSAEYGNYDALKLGLSASGPLSDTVAGRISLNTLERDGDIENVRFQGATNSSSERNIRERSLAAVSAKLNIQASDATWVSLSGRFQQDERNPSTGLLLDTGSSPRNALDPRPQNDVDSGGAAMTIEHDIGDMTLTSITGLEAYDLSLRADITDGFIASASSGAPAFVFAPSNAVRRIDEDLTQWSQEFRLDGETDGGTLWVGGLSALYSEFSSATDITSPVLPNGEYAADLDKHNVAAFGELTVPVGDRLRVIGGLRLSHEETDFSGRFAGRGGGAPAVASFQESGKTQDTLLTGRAALSYDFKPNLTAYVSLARGAKAGGFPFFNQSAAFSVAQQAFEKSTTWAYETGLKGDIWGGRLQFQTSVFFNDTENEQLFIFNPQAGQFRVENADTESYGLEVELRARPLERLGLSANLALLNARAVEDNGASVRRDNKVPFAPSISSGVVGEYEIPALSAGLAGRFVLRGQYQYVGGRQIDPANSKQLNSYDLLDVKLSYRNGGLELYAFADNLLDEEYVSSAFAAGVGPGGQRVFGGVPGLPRSYGVGVHVRY